MSRLAIALCLLLPSCAILDDVLATVTPGRAVECADRPTDEAKAKCIGVGALTDGLRTALEQAAELARRALEARAPGGAEYPISPAEERKLAGQLDRALQNLAHEVAVAQGGA